MKKSKIKAKKVIRRKRNPTIGLDDINRIGANVARDLIRETGQQGMFLRHKPGSFEYLIFNQGIDRINFEVTKKEQTLIFTVSINKSRPSYYEVNENGDEVYWFLTDLFTGELK